MALVFCFGLLSLGKVAHSLCPITEPRCAEIFHDRFGLTVAHFNEAPELKQYIWQDTLHCIDQDLCPLELDTISGEEQLCTDGYATELDYPCFNVDLMAFLPLPELGSHANASGNDIWGWTSYDDSGDATGYYALTGQSDGSSIVDVTDPLNPNVLAFIPSSMDPFSFCIWRDIKTYGDYAFIVADDRPLSSHGMQIVDLPAVIAEAKEYQMDNNGDVFTVELNETEHVTMYNEFGSSHNVFVNEDTGYLYSVGVYGYGDEDTIEGVWNGTDYTDFGIHVVDIRDPTNPVEAGIFNAVNYTHDIQCVVYNGPDTDYVGREICFAFTPEIHAVTIIDVEDKENMFEISRTEQMNSSAYVHQGWLTTNHEYLLMDDELDEVFGNVDQQTTFIYDVRDLDNPVLVDFYESNLTIIDHNQYIIDNGLSSDDTGYRGFSFQANYEGGLRILSLDNISDGQLTEVAYFDSYIWEENWFDISHNESNETDYDLIEGERHDTVSFRGTWSVYPFFKPHRDKDGYSDIVVLHNINTGLMVLRHDIGMDTFFTSAPTLEPTLSPTEELAASGKEKQQQYLVPIMLSLALLLLAFGIFLVVRIGRKKETGSEKPKGAAHVPMTSTEDGDYAGTEQPDGRVTATEM